MTHPHIEAALAPDRDFYTAREELGELYHQGDDQSVMEAAWELANWLRQETDFPLCKLPLETRKRMAEAAIALDQLGQRHRATLECLEQSRR